MSSAERKAEKLAKAGVDEVMALVRDFDMKGWLAAEAKLEGSAELEALQVAADESEQLLRAKLHDLCRDQARMSLLADKAQLQKYDSGYKASFSVSVNGMAEQGYHTDFRAAVDATA